jgi:hypothetical protein
VDVLPAASDIRTGETSFGSRSACRPAPSQAARQASGERRSRRWGAPAVTVSWNTARRAVFGIAGLPLERAHIESVWRLRLGQQVFGVGRPRNLLEETVLFGRSEMFEPGRGHEREDLIQKSLPTIHALFTNEEDVLFPELPNAGSIGIRFQLFLGLTAVHGAAQTQPEYS